MGDTPTLFDPNNPPAITGLSGRLDDRKPGAEESRIPHAPDPGNPEAIRLRRYERSTNVLLVWDCPADPLSFSPTAVVLVLVALVASYICARRAAAGVDPMIALGLCRAMDGGDSGIEEGWFRYC